MFNTAYELGDAIDKAGFDIVLHATNHDWTIREINFAEEIRKRIVFLNLDGTELNNWFKFHFGLKQQVNMQDDGALSRLISDIKVWLKIEHGDPIRYNLVPFESNGKWGFIDEEYDKLVVECIYDKVSAFNDGMACVKLNGKWGCVDNLGRLAIDCKYDIIDGFSNGVAIVCLAKKWGVIDKTGKLIVKRIYEAAVRFSENIIKIRLNGKWGLVNNAGNFVAECNYDCIAVEPR